MTPPTIVTKRNYDIPSVDKPHCPLIYKKYSTKKEKQKMAALLFYRPSENGLLKEIQRRNRIKKRSN